MTDGQDPAWRERLSRRVFVNRLTFMGGGVVLLGSACKDEPKPKKPSPRLPEALVSSHRTFTDDEWATLTAAVDRVLPKDEGAAGALEAGVPEYVDRILQTQELRRMKDDFIPGLAALDRRAQRLFKVPFAHAADHQKDEVLTLFKDSPESSGEAKWYEILVVLTMEGFLGDPSYGGNRGEVGWKAVGFTLVGRNVKADPKSGYDGAKTLDALRCGGGKGC